MNNNNCIDAAEMSQRLKNHQPINLIDVRESIEYHTFNAGGINIPLSTLPQAIDKIPYHKNDEIIVICKAGIRSKTAQSILQQNGYHNIRNLTGGLIALQKLK